MPCYQFPIAKTVPIYKKRIDIFSCPVIESQVLYVTTVHLNSITCKNFKDPNWQTDPEKFTSTTE